MARKSTSTLTLATLAAVLLVLLIPHSSARADAGSPPEELKWIRVSPEEESALTQGDDSVMDKYYDSEQGLMQPMVSFEANPDGCLLNAADVHWRKSTSNIGYKPTVKCDRRPLAVSLSNHLQKYMVLGWWKTEWSNTYPLTSNNLNVTTWKAGYTYKAIDKECDNSLSTRWRGHTSSTMKATNGSTYYARDYSTHIFEAKCGT